LPVEKGDSANEVKEIPSGKQAILVQKEEYSIDDLHNNDTKILALLNEAGSNYSFKGIMRKLGIHQQSLARALRRLGEMGLVEKSKAGYQLSRTVENTAARVEVKGREYMQLLQTYVPVNIRPTEIVRALIGKWFKNLRWIGLIESATGFTLQWSSDDGSFQINLRMVSDYIVIETNASTEREKLQSMAGSYAIYEQIVKALQNSAVPGNAYTLNRAINN
jgi:DNA-binding MarR family transcriptional regulator